MRKFVIINEYGVDDELVEYGHPGCHSYSVARIIHRNRIRAILRDLALARGLEFLSLTRRVVHA